MLDPLYVFQEFTLLLCVLSCHNCRRLYIGNGRTLIKHTISTMYMLWGSTGNGVVKSYFYLFDVGLDSSSACRLLNKILLNVCVPANKLHLFNQC